MPLRGATSQNQDCWATLENTIDGLEQGWQTQGLGVRARAGLWSA